MNDVVTNKIQSIQRCVQRARDEYEADRAGFAANYSHQDAALLNVLRGCETAIDLANFVIRMYKLGIPSSSRDSFRLLYTQRIIDDRLLDRLIKMVAFRNTLVHQYTKMDIRIVQAVIVSGLDDLLEFAKIVQQYVEGV
ncbi:type VII toxin-antitoxin system HepT family RNase toxin [Candidatus Amarolinea aalborgensis]|uniref:type VII toxin-antitoxin system HepT family RNase toxin n=1 Tax=Candidatus Amarolinea aalborgensis TaxID=2249329 RepID=UPI003BF9CAE9